MTILDKLQFSRNSSKVESYTEMSAKVLQTFVVVDAAETASLHMLKMITFISSVCCQSPNLNS